MWESRVRSDDHHGGDRSRHRSGGSSVTRLFVVCGLPGVGKTTVSETIAERTDGRLLRTDVVRKDLYDDPEYTPEETERVYAELLDRAERHLADGRTVVVDGTFRSRPFRERAVDRARDVGVNLRFVKVECEEGTVRERIRRRNGDHSDADFEIHQLFRETYDPLSVDHATVDNSGDRARTREQVERLL
jgi:predicted kinase